MSTSQALLRTRDREWRRPLCPQGHNKREVGVNDEPKPNPFKEVVKLARLVLEKPDTTVAARASFTAIEEPGLFDGEGMELEEAMDE